jgi:hypothetical protein
LYGPVVLAIFTVGDPSIAVNDSVFWIDLQDLVVCLNGLVILTFDPMGVPLLEVGLGILFIGCFSDRTLGISNPGREEACY